MGGCGLFWRWRAAGLEYSYARGSVLKNKEADKMTISPKQIYLLIVLVGSVLLIGDHLTSTALTDVGSPSDLGNACAPCGAPCTQTEKN